MSPVDTKRSVGAPRGVSTPVWPRGETPSRPWSLTDRKAQKQRAKRERLLTFRARRSSAVRPLRRMWEGHEQRKADLAADMPSDERRALITGLTLSLAGLCILMFFVYVFVFSDFQEARSQHQLLELFTQQPLRESLYHDEVATGQPEAILDIPAIHLRQVVVKGTSATDLTLGPGFMVGTAPIGTRGNAVIAGRRTTAGAPFRQLLSLRAGDRFTAVTSYGNFGYEVIRVGIAAPGSRDPVSPSTKAELTLVTSNPPYLSTGRAYVVASLTTRSARAPKLRGAPSASVRGLSGDSDAVLPSILWGVALACCGAATFVSYRRWRAQLAAVYLLTTPVVLAIALLWCESLFRLLPATL
jgi:sortase A